jgi:hypothetical protein
MLAAALVSFAGQLIIILVQHQWFFGFIGVLCLHARLQALEE